MNNDLYVIASDLEDETDMREQLKSLKERNSQLNEKVYELTQCISYLSSNSKPSEQDKEKSETWMTKVADRNDEIIQYQTELSQLYAYNR